MEYCSIPMICCKAQISIIATSTYAGYTGQICLFIGCGLTMTCLRVNNGWVGGGPGRETCDNATHQLTTLRPVAHRATGTLRCGAQLWLRCFSCFCADNLSRKKVLNGIGIDGNYSKLASFVCEKTSKLVFGVCLC